MEPRNMWQQIQGTYNFAAIWMRYDDYLTYGKEAKDRFIHTVVRPNRASKTWELQWEDRTCDLEKSLDEHMYHVLYAANMLMVRKWIGADAVWIRAGE